MRTMTDRVYWRDRFIQSGCEAVDFSTELASACWLPTLQRQTQFIRNAKPSTTQFRQMQAVGYGQHLELQIREPQH